VCVTSANTYLDQVVAQQAQLEDQMRAAGPSAKRARALAGAPGRADLAGAGRGQAVPPPAPGSAAPLPAAVEVRITGFWRWKTVLVPPNAFVVHTRRGRTTPLHLGLGVSFRYDPTKDSFLVVPGAMQTILINAFCICRELQGVLVQAYVQWIIQDFATAYKKLDFSDGEDPMRLVNLQLKEQAEAAIKDKVATMGVHEVLSDKQPIIEELTARLRSVAEGEGDSDQGLGLRIVTVQIKEAVVSSARLWENLQKPFRAEQGQLARLAELTAEVAVAEREMAAEKQRQTRQMQDEGELSELRARNERQLAELRSETTMHALRLERERHAEESEIGRLRIEQEYARKQLALDAELAMTRARAEADHGSALLDLERHRIRSGIDNDQTPASIQAQLVAALPEIVAQLPKPDELRTVTIGGTDATTLAGAVAQLGAVVGALRTALGSARPAG